MASSEDSPRDRRTISCPMVPNGAELVDVSTASSRDAPPAYNGSTHPQASPTHSPIYRSHDGAANSPTSPATRTFLSAVVQQVRSRSRSLSFSRAPSPSPSHWQDAGTSAGNPNRESEDILGSPLMRTASPTAMSPQPAASSQPTTPVIHGERHSNSLPVRPSARGESRSGSGSGSGNGSGPFTQCGRHSNEWLFHNYSVTGTVKGMLERRRS